MDINDLRSITTVAGLLCFLGIVAWAYGKSSKKGFDEAIQAAGGFEIVASQTGDFARDKGRQVAEALLQAHPDADVEDRQAITLSADWERWSPRTR